MFKIKIVLLVIILAVVFAIIYMFSNVQLKPGLSCKK